MRWVGLIQFEQTDFRFVTMVYKLHINITEAGVQSTLINAVRGLRL